MTIYGKSKINILEQAFTLVELILAIAIIGTLLAITLVAINPSRQFAKANDTQRKSDIDSILSAINQYQAENHGQMPIHMPLAGAPEVAIKSGGGAGDICSSLVTSYLPSLPHDPQAGSYTDCNSYDTQYTVSVSSSDNRITVSAIGELTNPIFSSR